MGYLQSGSKSKLHQKIFLLIYDFNRYETESAGKIDELEHAKMKLQARLAEAEETIEGLNSRCLNLEKLKQRLNGEINSFFELYTLFFCDQGPFTSYVDKILDIFDPPVPSV